MYFYDPIWRGTSVGNNKTQQEDSQGPTALWTGGVPGRTIRDVKTGLVPKNLPTREAYQDTGQPFPRLFNRLASTVTETFGDTWRSIHEQQILTVDSESFNVSGKSWCPDNCKTCPIEKHPPTVDVASYKQIVEGKEDE